MVERNISRHKYLVVGVITILIFCLGMSLGLVWDSKRVQWVEEHSRLKDLDYQSLQFQYLYLSTLEKHRNDTCLVLYKTLEQSVRDLGQTLEALISYQKESTINNENYLVLERDYVLDNLRYWLFAKQVQEACEQDIVTILYFYNKYDCSECENQGTLLTHFKKIFKDKLLVFPIDSSMKDDEVAISLVEAKYGITRYPSIVIKDSKYEGLIPLERLENLICSSFKTSQPECSK
jgi:hypothetical protein